VAFRAPWLPAEKTAGESGPSPAAPHCRFITSFGGAAYCLDLPYILGLCEFHFDCFEREEIDEEGRISDKLADQTRRRAINFHGVKLPDDLKPIL
jgi:hypothetical protein